MLWSEITARAAADLSSDQFLALEDLWDDIALSEGSSASWRLTFQLEALGSGLNSEQLLVREGVGLSFV